MINRIILIACFIILGRTEALDRKNSLSIDTRGQVAYTRALADWIELGLGSRIYWKYFAFTEDGELHWGQATSYSVIEPFVDAHLRMPMVTIGIRPRYQIKYDGTLLESTGKWALADVYLSSPLEVGGNLQLTPMLYLLRYGYGLDDKRHELLGELLLNVRVA